jgi:hypothetical protein
MSVEGVRHHTHPINSVSTSPASNIKINKKMQNKSKRLLLKSQKIKRRKREREMKVFYF